MVLHTLHSKQSEPWGAARAGTWWEVRCKDDDSDSAKAQNSTLQSEPFNPNL